MRRPSAVRTCYRCARDIRGDVTWHLSQVTGDFTKAFHRLCYEAEEREATAYLRIIEWCEANPVDLLKVTL